MSQKTTKASRENGCISDDELVVYFNNYFGKIFLMLSQFVDGNISAIKQSTKLAAVGAIIGLDAVIEEIVLRIHKEMGNKPVFGFANVVAVLQKSTANKLLSHEQFDDLKLLKSIRNTFAHRIDSLAEFDLFFGENSTSLLHSFFSDVKDEFFTINKELRKIKEVETLFHEHPLSSAENRRNIRI